MFFVFEISIFVVFEIFFVIFLFFVKGIEEPAKLIPCLLIFLVHVYHFYIIKYMIYYISLAIKIQRYISAAVYFGRLT